MKRMMAAWAFLVLLSAAPAVKVTVSDPVQIVPGPGFPDRVEFGESNNNLDLVRFGGRLFFAFRTAPHHFAGKEVKLYIVSTADEKQWDFEAEVRLGSDLREPRFLVMGEKLLFYFFQAGENPLAFSPKQTWVMERQAPGVWTSPARAEPFGPGCVLWRIKVRNGTAFASAYCGGENMYKFGNEPPGVLFMATEDGYSYRPVDSARPQVVVGGNEMDFEFDSTGDLYAAVRNEGGDNKTWGAKVCRAPAGDLGKWECKVTPMKYDSPLVFRRGDDIYMLARRNLGGAYDKNQRWIAGEFETLYYLVRYWFTKKRTSLYLLDKEGLSFHPVLDLPSRGDTAFPAMVEIEADHYLVYNYSSPLDGPDRFWLSGQLHPTRIYSTRLAFD